MLKWDSAIRNKGWAGLNNAAINTFNSHIINSFVREMIQNSNDARNNRLPIDKVTNKRPPLKIIINYKTISADNFPDFDGFLKIFARIKSAVPNASHMNFFRNAEKAMGDRQQVKLFIYEDYNTIGLEGEDNDDTKSFSSLVLSEGTSYKQDETAGGSYGIGKNAIFGFSKLRTVFYVSVNTYGEYIFQGIAKLASYKDEHNQTHEDRIFCGDGNELKSIRNLTKVPEKFRHVFTRSEAGLSQFAVCPSDNHNWIEEFTQAVLRNYWFLLRTGDLILSLKDDDEIKVELSSENLEELLYKYFAPKNYQPDNDIKPFGNPYEFYKCLQEGKIIKADISKLGQISFYYRELENNSTNKVAYIRNGMVVYTNPIRGFSTINYCGVFICDNDDGNKLLRLMEPPTHDSFDPERLDDKIGKYTKTDGKQALNAIKDLITNALQEIADKYKQPAEDMPWLDDLMSSLYDSVGSGTGKGTNEQLDKESIERIGTEMYKTLKLSSKTKNIIINNVKGDLTGTGGKKPHGPGPRPVGPEGPGPSPGKRKMKKTSVKSRSFKTNITKTINGEINYGYKLYLSAEGTITNTDILIVQKGDSGIETSFKLGEVQDHNLEKIGFILEKIGQNINGYRLKSVPIPSELMIFISEPYKSSLKILSVN